MHRAWIPPAANVCSLLSFGHFPLNGDLCSLMDILSLLGQGPTCCLSRLVACKGTSLELDYYQDFQVNCAKDAEKFQKMAEKEYAFDFLAELNTKYDQIRVQVLGKTPFPSLYMSYSYVQQKESCRGVMLYNPPLKNAGLISNQDGPSGGKSTKDHLTCDYCGKPRHTKDSCWKLHGRPIRGRGK
ncbi:hypothetical protein E1A91_A13G215100v1 [Gossypium mustelinum]|uniref:Retrotransposon gag domain-containing protein n=1 Tax=Gossypium mustelinum TaxID=34275 RepID=A0A5D2WKF7_GOSMU|nr:hypothetical protein E1A91_A13G215100v1 [Gossypium mustelinum]TYJ02256.1 hypothetical protein E1A91_A13G215100v1 [Gossypium mustelinum]